MSKDGDCNQFGSHTRCLESFPLEYMAEVATTSGASDLYAGHEHRFVLMATDCSWNSYIAE